MDLYKAALMIPTMIVWQGFGILAMMGFGLFGISYTLVAIPVIGLAVIAFIFAVVAIIVNLLILLALYLSFLPITGPISIFVTVGYVTQ